MKATEIRDLLTSLGLGTDSEEAEAAQLLREAYDLSPDTDLHVALAEVAPAEVLAHLLSAVRPFALMVTEIYSFLGRAAAKTNGHLELYVPLENNPLRLDTRRFAQYEKEILTKIQATELDMEVLEASREWKNFHDGYFPPDCAVDEDTSERCSHCSGPNIAKDAAYVTKCLDALYERVVSSRSTPNDDMLRQFWSTSRQRRRNGDNCSWHQRYTRRYFVESAREFRSAERPVDIQSVLKVLALPYWRHRWQLFEVWFLVTVLDSLGLAHLTVRTDGGEWRLAVGSVDKEPVATYALRGGAQLEVFYQFQGIPPAGLFAHDEDRPKLLVLLRDGGGSKKTLLAGEAKARRGMSRQDFEGALYGLAKWNPEMVLGANYFAFGAYSGVLEQDLRGMRVLAASACEPGGQVAQEILHRLRHFWRDTVGETVTVFLVDTSGSMRHLPLRQTAERLVSSPFNSPSEVMIATFSQSVAFYSVEDLQQGRVDLSVGGPTNLADAVLACQAELRRRCPNATRTEVVLVTDLDVQQGELDAFLVWARTAGERARICTWRSRQVESLLAQVPAATALVEIL